MRPGAIATPPPTPRSRRFAWLQRRLTGCELWVTLEPCAMCAGAIVHARIARLYYAAPDPKGGAVEHGARVFEHPQAHHRPEVYSGMGEAEAAELLRAFFRERR